MRRYLRNAVRRAAPEFLAGNGAVRPGGRPVRPSPGRDSAGGLADQRVRDSGATGQMAVATRQKSTARRLVNAISGRRTPPTLRI